MIYLLSIIAGIANSIMDRLSSKQEWEETIFASMVDVNKYKRIWWGYKDLSSGLKWKRDKDGRVIYPKREKFIGSSTVFVWTTDAWHFFQMVMGWSLRLGIVGFMLFKHVEFIGFVLTDWETFHFLNTLWQFIVEMGLLAICYSGTFEFFYAYVWTKRISINLKDKID